VAAADRHPQAGTRVALFGASGHARVVADMLERSGLFEIAGLIVSNLPAGTMCFGYCVLGSEMDLPGLIDQYGIQAGAIAVGDNWRRSQFLARIERVSPALRFVTAVHPSAQIGRDVTIGRGTVILAGAVVNSGSQIGPFSLINTKASLDHDGRMGSFTSLAPGATVGGGVEIGDFSAISLGASVIHRVRIGSHSVIGAGAVVIRDIPDRVVAFGVPAVVVRSRAPGDEYM
jgi:sugar O-acyltransferase (sialic acid O-acetyltransferase NeuD family)